MDLEEMFEKAIKEKANGQGKAVKAPAAAKKPPADADKHRKKAGKGAGVGAAVGPDVHASDRKEPAGVRAAEPAALRTPVAPAVAEQGYKGERPAAFIPNERGPDKWPKKHGPGTFKPGDSVWYREERWWITNAPPTWESTSFVQISDSALRPNSPIPSGVRIMSVHADLLELAPTRKGPLLTTPQPTKHAIEQREKMKKEGVTDIGDTVASMLRGKSLDEAYEIAAEFIGVPENELRAKYVKLNPGQQRMNLGNRMRGYMKKSGG